MLPSTRRRAQQHVPPPPAGYSGSDEDVDEEEVYPEEEDGDVMGDEIVAMEGEEDLEEEEGLASPGGPETPLPNLDPPPSYLREISTLASWTVSSSKPGCSIPQLRHPSPSLFWQSDGPQPHYLNIHFFKLVRIVGLRLYLDFEQDESYTPTRIIFLAGSGMNDLQEWGEMRLESPRGWVWADFSGVGDASDDDSAEEEEDSEDDEAFQQRMLSGLHRPRNRRTEHASSDSENMPLPPQRQRVPSNFPTHLDPHPFDTNTPAPQPPQHQTHHHTPHFSPPPHHETATPILPRPAPRHPFSSLSPNPHPKPTNPQTQSPRRPKMPVLRAHIVQVKILENHQNGKDTHLRGLQIFALNNDEGGQGAGVVRVTGAENVGVGAGAGAGAGEGVGGVQGGDVGKGRKGRVEVLELGGGVGMGGGFDIR